MLNKSKQACTLCGEYPKGSFDLTGIKVVDGEERAYQICKNCCFDVGRFNPYDQKSTTKRKSFWESVTKRI